MEVYISGAVVIATDDGMMMEILSRVIWISVVP